MISRPSGFWTLERNEFGKPSVVRHRHAAQMVTGYIRTEPDGKRYAQCPLCGAVEPLDALEAQGEGEQH